MKIGRKFNQLTHQEYIQILKNHHKYTDFNTLGLYRSIVENTKLDIAAKIEIRELAHEQFFKTFEFLQLKDPVTYIKVSTLGQTLTVADEWQLWENIKVDRQKILKEKRIKHRNFGIYSKHICGYKDCPFDGVMIPNTADRYRNMWFDSDRNKWLQQLKVQRQQLENREFRHKHIELLVNFSEETNI